MHEFDSPQLGEFWRLDPRTISRERLAGNLPPVPLVGRAYKYPFAVIHEYHCQHVTGGFTGVMPSVEQIIASGGMLTPEEVAKILTIYKKTVYVYVQNGLYDLVAVTVTDWSYRFPAPLVDATLERLLPSYVTPASWRAARLSASSEQMKSQRAVKRACGVNLEELLALAHRHSVPYITLPIGARFPLSSVRQLKQLQAGG